MIETTIARTRNECPSPIQRSRRRRQSRAAYRSALRLSPPRQLSASSTQVTSPDTHLYYPGQTQPQYLGFLDIEIPASSSGPVSHQHDDKQIPSCLNGSHIPYTLTTNAANSTPNFDSNNASCLMTLNSSRLPNDGLDTSWNEAIAKVEPDMDEMSMSDAQFESYGSSDSMIPSIPDTMASSISEGYVFTGMSSEFGSPQTTNQLNDLNLSNGFFESGQTYDSQSPESTVSPIGPDGFHFDSDHSRLSPEWNFGVLYSAQGCHFSTSTLMPFQDCPGAQSTDANTLPQIPWNSQQAQISKFQVNANAGIVAFQEDPGPTYRTFKAREEYLEGCQQQVFASEPIPLICESGKETDEWSIASYPSSCNGSQNSQASPVPHARSPIQIEAEPHSHLFSTDPRMSKPKARGGRQRNLTTQEKKAAREVREAKACWACHISKTKCSPCSPGNPCEQCTRLAGKRRFCNFSCFNDPLESLYVFLVPDYVMGHFTKANVESYIANNASSWGTQYLPVRLSWGYRIFLEANMVALSLWSNESDMGYQHQVFFNEVGKPMLVRKQSPPLGIPFTAIEDMEYSYSIYIQDIVQTDLLEYVSMAYDDQVSKFSGRLLGAVCSYYVNGLEAEDECLLRQAIEMHITSTILKKSLIFDSDSMELVQNYMQQQYPAQSAPRCAQRQIKLAFFMLQRQKIMSVLKDWGNMMWTIQNPASNGKRWATGFCVFTLLTLVMDKTLGAAYNLCESRIAYHGFEAAPQREEFQELVRLTQTELFERCKEIFHWKFKTRKAGREACNPVRDGMEAIKEKTVYDEGIARLIFDLQALVRDFDDEIRAHASSSGDETADGSAAPYTNAGRLAGIFLNDFLSDPELAEKESRRRATTGRGAKVRRRKRPSQKPVATD